MARPSLKVSKRLRTGREMLLYSARWKISNDLIFRLKECICRLFLTNCLWTDAFEHKYVQEIGTMNVFFIIRNTAITPDLEQGTILDGVTRQSTITLLKEMGFTIEERPLSIDDIIDAYKAGLLYEVFGTG